MAEVDEKIIEMLKTEQPGNVLETVSVNYHDEPLKPGTLGALFVAYVSVQGWVDEENGISQEVLVSDLCEINKWFKSTNGNQWARSDGSSLGKKYVIERTHKQNAVYSIKLNGFNQSIKKNRQIRNDIVKELQKQRCVVLDVGTQIEIDHKSGRYDDERIADQHTQQITDFQPMHKTVNDAKRHHCIECLKNNKRYNAQRLGYKEGWIKGDENDTICLGCYWYDPKEFNRVISKDFKKDDFDKEK